MGTDDRPSLPSPPSSRSRPSPSGRRRRERRRASVEVEGVASPSSISASPASSSPRHSSSSSSSSSSLSEFGAAALEEALSILENNDDDLSVVAEERLFVSPGASEDEEDLKYRSDDNRNGGVTTKSRGAPPRTGRRLSAFGTAALREAIAILESDDGVVTYRQCCLKGKGRKKQPPKPRSMDRSLPLPGLDDGGGAPRIKRIRRMSIIAITASCAFVLFVCVAGRAGDAAAKPKPKANFGVQRTAASAPPSTESILESIFSEVGDAPPGEGGIPVFWDLGGGGASAAVSEALANCAGLLIGSVDSKGGGRGSMRGGEGSKERDILVAPSLPAASSLLASAAMSGVSDVENDEEATKPPARARAFTMMEHPVRRAVNAYRALPPRIARRTTLEQYASSDDAVDNPMVRSLTGAVSDEALTAGHVDAAKDALRKHVLVGVDEIVGRSLERFEQYFGWWGDIKGDGERMRCQADVIQKGAAVGGSSGGAQGFVPDGPEIKAISIRNWADLELYRYAKVLFQEQGALMKGGR